jgi:putative transposase
MRGRARTSDSVGRIRSLMGPAHEYELDAALETAAHGNDRLVVHSDRGVERRSPGSLSRIENAKLLRSMSRTGCSLGKAVCEGFFGRLKTELFSPRDGQATALGQFIPAMDSCIRGDNEKQSQISLGSLSPIEYRGRPGLAA